MGITVFMTASSLYSVAADESENETIFISFKNKSPKGLTVIWVLETLVKRLIFANQLPHHRINENQQLHRKQDYIPLIQ